ncbi:MAG: YIP1 family protein [Xanthomonadales bacterium]|nr:YIP1 family protein [Xanthomonadales bacterium]
MNDKTYTVFNAMTDIVASPAKAFDQIKVHTRWLWWPLLITILLSAGMLYYYFNWVDFSWFVEETIRGMPAESRAEAAEVTRNFMQPGSTTWMSVGAVVIGTFVIYAIMAIYFHLANKLTSRAELSYGQWFSFSVWANFVSIFGALAAIVFITMSDTNQVSAEALQLTSLNALFVHAEAGDKWFSMASSFSLITVWTLALMVIGYTRWTGASTFKSSIIVLLPWVLIYGIWAITV